MPIPPAPDEAEHGGLPNVDVPAEQRDPPERRNDLRPVAFEEDARPWRARGPQRLDRAGPRFLERLAEKLADETDRAKRDRHRSRERAGPEYRDEKQRPDERVDRARRDEQELREIVDRGDGTMLCAASTPSGTAMRIASIVPSDAICSVSMSASCTPPGSTPIRSATCAGRGRPSARARRTGTPG